jgi:vitamin K-dependent gamma-carboxylase
MKNKLFKPVRADSLAVFRILFGIIMLWEVYRYFKYGWIERYWVRPVMNFTYEGFSWVSPLSADGMLVLFVILGFLAFFITIGFLYRISIALFFLLFTYTFLLEQTRYLNHFYLVVLISFLMMFLPAHRKFSVDSKIFSKLKTHWIPNWTIWILQFQIGIVYLYGGIAKLNRDWLSGSPMDMWLPSRSDFPLIGSLFQNYETALVMSYSGLILDLVAFPLLMIRKTRPWIILALILFHLMNDRIFSIGIFPWFMIGVLTIYLPTTWPRDLYSYLSGFKPAQKQMWITATILAALAGSWFHEQISIVPFLISAMIFVVLVWDFRVNPREETHLILENPKISKSNWIVAGVLVWLFIQITVPLRHYTISGNPSWTEEGHRFAWHMKLRSKSCVEQFYVLDRESSERREINGMPFLESWQRDKVSARPQMIAQYSSFLSKLYDDQPIYADIRCSLNGREQRSLVDPNRDLTQVTFKDWKQNDWILRYD